MSSFTINQLLMVQLRPNAPENKRPMTPRTSKFLSLLDDTMETFRKGRAMILFLNDNMPEGIELVLGGHCDSQHCFKLMIAVKTSLELDMVRNIIEALPQATKFQSDAEEFGISIGPDHGPHVCCFGEVHE